MSDVYTSTGSLAFKDRQFYLDEKPLTILSGAMHYFRVVPEYWKDRLMKMKACGLNTVETYVYLLNFHLFLNLAVYLYM